MENNFANETLETKAGSSGSASVLFLMSILGLACAAFTVTMPGTGEQILSDACSALHCESSSSDNGLQFASLVEQAAPGAFAAPATSTGVAKAAALQPEVALSTADRQWQIAQSFNAQGDALAAQGAQSRLAQIADNSATAQHLTPLARLADAVPAMP